MSFSHANLFFNQVEIIQQPFSCRRNPAIRLDGLCQKVVDSKQNPFVVGQSRQQFVVYIPLTQCMLASQGLAVLLHLVRAEKFRPQRR